MPVGAKCPCVHHKMVPILILLVGLTFLLTAMGIESAEVNSYVWPVLIILIGLQKLFQNQCKCCSHM